MKISHRYKFVYISIPKTGSTSVRYLLNKYSDETSGSDFRYIHLPSKRIKSYFSTKGWNWDEYFKFTVVRHPISRLRSTINSALKLGKNYSKNGIVFPGDSVNDQWTLDVIALYEKQISLKQFMLQYRDTQYSYVCDDSNKNLLDVIVKLEDLENGLQNVWKKLGLNNRDLINIPKLNVTDTNNTSNIGVSDISYWNNPITVDAFAGSRNIIMEGYEQDFKFFGYE